MNKKNMQSEFAPAARADSKTLSRQAAVFGDNLLAGELLEGVPDAVMVLNSCRQIVYLNTAALRLSAAEGSTSDCVGLRPGEFLHCIHADNETGGCGTTLFCRVCGAAGVILNGIKGNGDVQECRIRRTDGSALNLLVWGRPFSWDDIPFTIFSIQDISSRTRLRILERSFFHDVLNSAGGIRNMVEVLQDVDTSSFKETQRLIHDLANDMIEQIQFQRDVGYAENGDLKTYMAAHPVRGIVEEVIARSRKNHICQGRGIRLLEGNGDCAVITDAGLLKRCLTHVIRNALETIRAGDEVMVGWEEEDGCVDIQVFNPGYIAEDVQLQIFQRSFSTRETRRGIGTYGVKIIVEHYLDGTVWFQSDKKEGTYFHVRIPQKR
ncbi:MAG: PAS domain-containing sensor histidine kinase [Sediminispirochaetaceae bacterium]